VGENLLKGNKKGMSPITDTACAIGEGFTIHCPRYKNGQTQGEVKLKIQNQGRPIGN
jgi:hypothetical protein